jgi:CubicO group peptidase (beta-lactamase class C family)
MSGGDIAGRIQQLADSQVARGGSSNIVLAMQSGDGRINAVAAAGYADVAGVTPMTSETPYLLASIAKMYTATIVMTLVDEGELKLEDRISGILSCDLVSGIHVVDGKDYSREITVGQLLNQTSGLADYFTGAPNGGDSLADELKAGRDRLLAIEDILDIVRGLQPEFAPGASRKAHYSDTNYALLGAIILAATGKPVNASLRRIIYEPLGLKSTYAFDHSRDLPEPSVVFVRDQPVSIPLFLTSCTTDGGMVAPAGESLRFLRAFFTGELLPVERIAFMTSDFKRMFFPLEYGHGVMRFKQPRWTALLGGTPPLVGHSGSTGSFAFYDAEHDLYLAGTVNQMDRASRPFRLMAKMIRLAD